MGMDASASASFLEGIEVRGLKIRKAGPADFGAIWPIFREIVSAGETYPSDPDTSEEEAFDIWTVKPQATFVAELNGEIVGTYFLKANQPGLGNHVCNCGYMVSSRARSKGIASAMCEHSQGEAKQQGFKAMQFNLVVSTNEGALRLWQKLGFEIVGTLPKAFRYKDKRYVDAHVMYKWLDS
jgi:ribosomal protein S18 acetylase RimI-like enzyme